MLESAKHGHRRGGCFASTPNFFLRLPRFEAVVGPQSSLACQYMVIDLAMVASSTNTSCIYKLASSGTLYLHFLLSQHSGPQFLQPWTGSSLGLGKKDHLPFTHLLLHLTLRLLHRCYAATRRSSRHGDHFLLAYHHGLLDRCVRYLRSHRVPEAIVVIYFRRFVMRTR